MSYIGVSNSCEIGINYGHMKVICKLLICNTTDTLFSMGLVNSYHNSKCSPNTMFLQYIKFIL